MKLNISEIEFSQIKENLKTFLLSQDEFKDYNFDASGLSVLLDVLAYQAHHNSYYLNMAFNEAFLSAAILRKNVVAHAKSLNYIPSRPEGAVAYVDLDMKSGSIPVNPATEIYIPKYTKFAAGGYDFMAMNAYTLTNANSYSVDDIELRQGKKVEVAYVSDGTAKQEFVIQNTKIDNQVFEVRVDDTLWVNQNDLTQINATCECYWIEETEDGYVKILFGNGVIGKIPPSSVDIDVLYSETEGTLGNNLSTFTLNQVLADNYSGAYDNSDFDITTTQNSASGSDLETIASIQANAPKFYQSYGRLVTVNDWESYLGQNSIVNIVHAWGGDESDYQPKYGTVYIVVKPNGSETLTVQQESDLTTYLNGRKIAPIRFEFVDPHYFRIDITTTAYYSSEYLDQIATVKNNIEQAVSDYFTATLNRFNYVLQHSDLISLIKDVAGVENVTLAIQPWMYFSKSATKNYYWELENQITPSSLTCTITGLYGTEGFYDDGAGKIIDRSTSEEVGTINYTDGIIEINDLDITASETGDYVNGFKMYFDTPSEDVYFKKHRLVSLESQSTTMIRFT